jgi:hypothetical protein
MLKFVSPKLVVKNRSKKSVNLLGIVPIKPGQVVDLFKVSPNLSESTVIDALRAPTGQLYREVHVSRNVAILQCVLTSFHGYKLGPDQLNIDGAGEAGQVISASTEEGEFTWSFHNEEDRLSLEPPLTKEGDYISLPKANSNTNGYLAKEDWLLFKGKSQGIRIWQYQDFAGPVKSVLAISSFENGSSVGTLAFNEDYIVDGSAVAVDLNRPDRFPLANASIFARWDRNNQISVQQHLGKTVLLDQKPDASMGVRVYFLVVLPHTVDVPADYEAPSKFIRDQRIELMDSIDIDVIGSKIVRGQKAFTNSVTVNQSLGVNVDSPSAELDVNGKIKGSSLQITDSPSQNYTLISNGLGEASWGASPAVAPIPPHNYYPGQLWVRVPDYETFIYDGSRGKWLSIHSIEVTGAKNSTSCENTYLHILDNIPSNVNSTVLPYDATLVSLVASSETLQNWTAEIHLNGSSVEKALLPIMSSDRSYNNNLNVDFRAGDKIQLFVSGRDISMPHIKAIFRKKV